MSPTEGYSWGKKVSWGLNVYKKNKWIKIKPQNLFDKERLPACIHNLAIFYFNILLCCLS